MVKTTLKFGSIFCDEMSSMMGAKLVSKSKDTPRYEIKNITTDVLEISNGTLFIASEDNSLAEMMAASKNGAKCILCTKAPASLDNIPEVVVIVCSNVWNALEKFAKEYIKRGHHRTMLLSGSKGRTRTGEFICSVLGEINTIYKSEDKKTTTKEDVIALIEIPQNTDFFLIERKIRDKRDLPKLSKYLDCNLSEVQSLKIDIGQEEEPQQSSVLCDGFEIALDINEGKQYLICECNSNSKSLCVRNDEIELFAVNVKEKDEKITFDILFGDDKIQDVVIHCSGIENVYSALFATLVGLEYGVTIEKIKTGLKNTHPSCPATRIYTLGKITLIEDSASATIENVTNAVNTLCDIASLHEGSRKIAFIGDIRDFGQDTRGLHENLGAYIVDKNIDKLFTIGVAAEQIGIGAMRAGMSSEDILGNMDMFSPLKSASVLAKMAQAGDILLVKVGRPNIVAEIVDYLKTELDA